MIDLSIRAEALGHNIQLAKQHNVIIPTIEQMKHPETIPPSIQEQLQQVGLWDLNPLNLFRITWKNEPVEQGGQFGAPNYIELPKSLTGVDARILCLVGKWFPTGCHKVGASFGCLVPRLVTGQFDATVNKAVWPSTGNYCRGGAFNSALLSVYSVAILPSGMSKERFDWLENIASEVIATPGTESNVKEIFDEVWHIRNTRPDCVIFNQFEEMGNHMWHYHVTGSAIQEIFESIKDEHTRLAGACFTSGSAGTIGCGDYLKEQYPTMKLAVGEALQCPTLLNNGFGEHRIEGIGDKHVPWVHNVRNTDMVIDIDDNDSQNLLHLFNEPAGRAYLAQEIGVDQQTIDNLSLFGISGIANMLCAIKMAKYYEMDSNDVIFTVLTDSEVMYDSRVAEMDREGGAYTSTQAAVDFAQHLSSIRTDVMQELSYWDKKRIHNLKYYTWVEQQGRSSEELNTLWYDYDNTWGAVHKQAAEIDELINAFNEETGLLR